MRKNKLIGRISWVALVSVMVVSMLPLGAFDTQSKVEASAASICVGNAVKTGAEPDSSRLCSQRKLAVTSDGNLHVVYHHKDGTGILQIYHAESSDGGATWTEEQLTFASRDQNFPALAVDSMDNLHLVWEDGREGQPGIVPKTYYQKKTTTWQPAELVASYATVPSIAIDGNDNVHVVYGVYVYGAGYYGGGNGIRWRMRTPAGWQSEESISENKYWVRSATVAIDGDNNVHVAWSHDPRYRYYDMHYRKRTASGWEPEVEIARDSDSRSIYASVVIDSNNYVHVVWQYAEGCSSPYSHDGYFSIRYRKYTDSWQPVEILEGPTAFPQNNPVIAIDSNSHIHVVWSGQHAGSPACHQIRYREYTTAWQPIQNLTSSNSANQTNPNSMWAFYPMVRGIKTNQLENGYSFVWMDGTTIRYCENCGDGTPGVPVSIAISPREATITAGGSISYTAEGADAYGTTFDITAEAVFTIDVGAGGTWVGNTYTSEFNGEWTVTGTYEGLVDTATLSVTTAKVLPVPYYGQGSTDWCMLASMSMILKYYGQNIHLWDIAEEWGLETDGALKLLSARGKVEKYFGDRGLSARRIGIDFDSVKDSIDEGKPVLLTMRAWNPLDDLNHAVVIVGYKELDGTREVYIHDPAGSFVKEKLGLPPPYIRLAVDWQDVERYAGWQSFALSIGGDPSQPDGTIDFFLRAPLKQLTFARVGAEGSCYSSYDRKEGLIWEYTQPYPLVFGSDDQLILLVPVSNHTEHSQMYTFEVKFTEKVDEFHWRTFVRLQDIEVDRRDTSEVWAKITLGDIIGEYGEYAVTLRLLDSGCVETYDEIVFPSIKYGPVVPPTADFTASLTSGLWPLSVSFTDNSTGDINSWLWDFGDGWTSTQQNPHHLYLWPDVYTVKLTVSGPTGEHTEVKESYIEVRPRIRGP